MSNNAQFIVYLPREMQGTIFIPQANRSSLRSNIKRRRAIDQMEMYQPAELPYSCRLWDITTLIPNRHCANLGLTSKQEPKYPPSNLCFNGIEIFVRRLFVHMQSDSNMSCFA